MKNTILLGLACCSSLNLFASARLHGKITNRLADSVQISWTPLSIAYKPVAHTLALAKDGSFSTDIDLREDFTKIKIGNGNQETEIVMQPNADLAIFIDGNNFDSSLRYEGRGKEIAGFSARLLLEKHDMAEFSTDAQRLFGNELKEFEAGLQKLEEEILAFLAENGKELPENYKDYFKADYHYMVYAIMEKYPRFHEMAKQNGMTKEIPKENYRIVDDIPEVFDDKYLCADGYRSYLTNLMVMKVLAAQAGSNIKASGNAATDSMYARAYRLMTPASAEYYIGERLLMGLKNTAVADVEKRFEIYKTHFSKSKNLPLIEEAIAHQKTIGPGKSAIDFDIVTPEGVKMTLSDLKGKVVYIDFWSRGCVPCVAELPFAKKIRAHFKDRPVAFVNISLDDEETWRAAIKELALEGINTHVDGQFQSPLAKQYGVTGIPSYFLIDKNGKFANFKTIERPSDPEKLIAQIESLLK